MCRVYKTYEELCEDYRAELLHPGDLKPGLAKAINTMLEPVRKHFDSDASAKALLKKVKAYKTTR